MRSEAELRAVPESFLGSQFFVDGDSVAAVLCQDPSCGSKRLVSVERASERSIECHVRDAEIEWRTA